MKYSFLLPTRSRGHLISHMINAVLEQEGDFDFELVISNNHSTDNTDEVLDTFDDPRIRRIRPEKPLSMTDNWEFVLENATGDRIIFVEDDDCISTTLLREVDKTFEETKTEVITWGHAFYAHPNHYETNERNSLRYVQGTGALVALDGKLMLRKLFDKRADYYWKSPTMRNSCCTRDVVARVKQQMRNGRFFTASCPDYSAAAVVLSTVEGLVYVDKPLMIFGIERENNVASTLLKPDHEFWSWFGEDPASAVLRCPLSGLSFGTIPIETLLRTKEIMPALADFDINWRRYFAHYYNFVQTYEAEGNDARAAKEEFWSVLWKRPLPFVLGVLAEIGARQVKRRLVGDRAAPGTTVKGDQAGFSDIGGARVYLDSRVHAH